MCPSRALGRSLCCAIIQHGSCMGASSTVHPPLGSPSQYCRKRESRDAPLCMAGVSRQSSYATAGASPSPQIPHWWHGDRPRDPLLKDKVAGRASLVSEPYGLPSQPGMPHAHRLPSEPCSWPAPHPQGQLPWCSTGCPALAQQEERGENQRFPSLQKRLLAGKAELHFPECSWPCLLSGERLRDPATGSSLLLNYSPYYLFVVFLHLTVSLVHLIGGLLPLPARSPEPNSLLGLIY